MISPHSRLAAARESESSPPQHAPAPEAPTRATLPAPTGAAIPSLVAHSAMRGRGNGTVRATAIQHLQRTSGNRAVQRLLAGRTAAGAPPINSRSGGVSIQRNGTGLAGAGAVGQFTANIKAPLAAWDSYGADVEKRQRALFEPATKQLEALGAPRITSTLQDSRMVGDSTFAAFMPATWMVLINPSGLQANATDEEKARVAGAIYHEIRHAEQYYRIARMLAGEGAEQELSALGLRSDVVAQARKNPLPRPQSAPKKGLLESDKEFGPREQGFKEQQQEYQEAKAWHEASIRYHDMTVKKDATEKEYHAAKATKDTDPERYKAAWVHYTQAYKLYQSTAVEADAWAVGGMVEAKLGFKPNTLETELAKMPADPRTFKAITTGDTPSTPLRSRAIGTGAPPSYKPQLGSTSPPISTVGSDVDGSMPPFMPPVRTPRKLGAFSPLTPLDPSTIGAPDEVPFTPPVRQGRNLGGFSPLTPFDPSTISATDTQVPDLDDSLSGGSISTSTPQIMPPVRQGRQLGGFSPLTPLDPRTIGAIETQVPDQDDSPSGGAISTPTPQIASPSNGPRRPRLGVFSPRPALNPSTISATGPETPTPSATGGLPRREDDETNLQLTVQRHAVPEALAQALSHQQIPEEELTKKG